MLRVMAARVLQVTVAAVEGSLGKQVVCPFTLRVTRGSLSGEARPHLCKAQGPGRMAPPRPSSALAFMVGSCFLPTRAAAQTGDSTVTGAFSAVIFELGPHCAVFVKPELPTNRGASAQGFEALARP